MKPSVSVASRRTFRLLRRKGNKSRPRNQKENHPFGWFFFLEWCLPSANDVGLCPMMYASQMMCACGHIRANSASLRHEVAQHHCAARHNITAAPPLLHFFTKWNFIYSFRLPNIHMQRTFYVSFLKIYIISENIVNSPFHFSFTVS